MTERSELEQRTRELLDESADALDGRIRSRLTQARQAAIEVVPRKGGARSSDAHSTAWQRWVPAGGLVAAAVLAVMFWPRGVVMEPAPAVPAPQVGPQLAEDLDLILGADPFDFTIEEDELLGT